jgi:hypothetical protein
MFSCLNSEKPTPLFLNLARSTNAGSNLSSIRKQDGTQFPQTRKRLKALYPIMKIFTVSPLVTVRIIQTVSNTFLVLIFYFTR